MANTADLGHSLELSDGDITIDGGRLVEVSGLANMVQALTLRVLTPLGSDRFAITYGLDVIGVFAQAVGTRTAQDLLRLSLVRTLDTDPRVREIRDITVLGPAPGSDRRLWPVVVTVVTIDSAQHTIALDVVI